MEKLTKWQKPLTLLQVLFGLISIIMAVGYLKGEFRHMAVFVVPFIIFILLYLATLYIRKKQEAETEKAKQAEKEEKEDEQ